MKLSLALEIDKKSIDDALSQAKVYQAEIKRFDQSRIFVNTNFKRKSEPIFALAMCESSRNFSLYQDKDFLFKTKEEILEIISQRVKKHYDSKKGELGIWGKIASYQLHLFDKVYVFDTQGNMLPNEEEVPENRATLELK